MTSADLHSPIASRVRASGTSFYWPMKLQRTPQRQALYAIYAYCRVLDDIADRSGPIESKQHDLKSWREHIERIYAGDVIDGAEPDFFALALADIIRRFDLPRAPFEALIDGMEADVNGPIVAPEWSALQRYCAQVAGSVGELCLGVWNWHGPLAVQFARSTGEALQLTNILRDLSEDAANGRLYLPKEALSEAGINAQTPADVLAHANISAACAFVVNHVEECYQNASSLWRQSRHKNARPAWMMLCLYHALLRKIVKNGFGPDHPRIRLSTPERIYHLFVAYLKS